MFTSKWTSEQSDRYRIDVIQCDTSQINTLIKWPIGDGLVTFPATLLLFLSERVICYLLAGETGSFVPNLLQPVTADCTRGRTTAGVESVVELIKFAFLLLQGLLCRFLRLVWFFFFLSFLFTSVTSLLSSFTRTHKRRRLVLVACIMLVEWTPGLINWLINCLL